MSDHDEIELLKNDAPEQTPEEVVNSIIATMNSVISQQNILFEKIVEMSGHIQGLGEHVTFLLLKDPDYMKALVESKNTEASNGNEKTTTVE